VNFRIEGWVQTPLGAAVAGANVAVLDQPADFSSQPGSPLASIFSSDTSNSATITAAFWQAQEIAFTFVSVPADVVPNSFIGVSGVTPATFDSTTESPYLVISVVGNVVNVVSLTNPGTYVSGGTVATSLLPNPVTTDGNGYYFAYAAAGLYSLQVYYGTVELDFPDQQNGTVAGGSVTSVALTMPAQFSIAGSPITNSGTFAVTWTNESANLVFAGPVSGGAAAPTFRSLVSADLPGGFGTVSSVGLTLSVPAIFTESVTGSPVTGSGTLGLTFGLATEPANFVWAGPTSGSAAQPTFRGLVAGDIPGAVLSVATLTLTSAQIKALHGTPLTIIAAPGANRVIVSFQVFLQYKFVTTAYVVPSGANIDIGFSGEDAESIQVPAAGLIDQTANTVAVVSSTSVMPQSAAANVALQIDNDNVTEFTVGDGTLVITVWYFVLTLS
jgi:hypothetical protein